MCRALRATGMPVVEIRRYVEAVARGEASVHERYALLQQHQARVRAQLAELQTTLAMIEAKVDTYGRRIATGAGDRPWENPANEPY